MRPSSTARSSPGSARPEPADVRARRRVGDPLGPILALGRRSVRVGFAIGIAGALIVHGAPAMQAARSFGDLRDFARQVREAIEKRLQSEIDLDMRPPPPPPPPPPEPEPPKEPEPPPPKTEAEPPPPPPAPAEAGKILTSEPDPDEPVDLTDQGFVTGTGDRFAGGVTASTGTSKTAVRSADATPGGVPGGTGKPTAPPPPAQDLSRAPMPTNAGAWRNCGFPAEADIENINSATVTLVVTVGPDGRAKSVNVVKDQGYGFGKLARDCAFRQSFSTGLDSAGKPVTKTTPPFTVRFTR